MVKTMYPYLMLDGQGQEAVKFYEQAFQATVLDLKLYGDMPENPDHPFNDAEKNRVLHARLQVGDTNLMISDTFPNADEPPVRGDFITFALMVEDAKRAEEVFQALQEGGTVVSPLETTFFSARYGKVMDPFGVIWQVSAEESPK